MFFIKVLKITKKLFEYFYSRLIIMELIIRQKIFKQNFLFGLGGYGDQLSFISYCENYFKNIKFLNLGSIQEKILKIRVKKEKILDIFFKIPHWRVYYRIYHFVAYSKYIKKTKYDIKKLLSTPNTKRIKSIILKNSINEKDSFQFKQLASLLSKNYVCFFVKELVDNNYIWTNSIEQELHNSSEKEKVIKILKFILKKNNKILILGENRERGIDFLYALFKKKKTFKNKIFFVKDYIKSDDISKKILLYNNSLGYIGNGSGHANYFYFLRKKTIIFDYLENIRPNSKNERILNNLYLHNFLYKKVKKKSSSKILPRKILHKIILDLINLSDNKKREFIKKNYKISSNDIKEIKNSYDKIFNN